MAEGETRWTRRLFWFVALWLAGVATVTMVGLGIRAMIL